jgi:ATP-dependent DNA helicase RecG
MVAMPIDIRPITDLQVLKILNTTEGHFADLKSKDIQPAKLTQTMAAFANADGGELYVGVDEIKTEGRRYGCIHKW